MKSVKAMVACALEGHSKFCRSIGYVRLWGNSLQPRFCLICRVKARCGEEAFLLKAFLVTFGSSQK
ncbi:MAG TPA: hypothetical protein VK668_04175 [Mucilaginibacter sp.]|nr:hypothetical protein [Mucilaginibacter sp.]